MGVAEGEAAEIDPEERRRLWMQYLRSRQPHKKHTDYHMPASLAGAATNALHHGFDLWLKAGKLFREAGWEAVWEAAEMLRDCLGSCWELMASCWETTG